MDIALLLVAIAVVVLTVTAISERVDVPAPLTLVVVGVAASYDLLFGTPHGVDLSGLCAATRTPHWRVTERGELEHALASPNGGLEVIEAVIRRDNRRTVDEEIRGLAD